MVITIKAPRLLANILSQKSTNELLKVTTTFEADRAKILQGSRVNFQINFLSQLGIHGTTEARMKDPVAPEQK